MMGKAISASCRIVDQISQKIEHAAQRIQGKSWVAESLPREVDCIVQFLPRKDAIVFDVGANKGAWTRELLRRAGDRVQHIYTFEPSVHNHEHIRGNTHESAVTIVKKGVSDVSGVHRLYYDQAGSGLASLSRRKTDHHNIYFNQSEDIETTTIDEFISEQKIDVVDFLKMDIEGHELSALKGATGSLSSKKIRALSFEFGGANIDSRTFFQDYFYLLTGYGYRIARIAPVLPPIPIGRYTERLEHFETANYIAHV